jgi:hypothetical protein
MDRVLVIKGLAALKEDYLMGKCGVNSVVIDEAIRLLKENEYNSKCPCQECVTCMCDDYRRWVGLPD